MKLSIYKSGNYGEILDAWRLCCDIAFCRQCFLETSGSIYSSAGCQRQPGHRRRRRLSPPEKRSKVIDRDRRGLAPDSLFLQSCEHVFTSGMLQNVRRRVGYPRPEKLLERRSPRYFLMPSGSGFLRPAPDGFIRIGCEVLRAKLFPHSQYPQRISR